jgi:hypothetical protein
MFPIWGQSMVQISNLSLTEGATPTLTFEVSWSTPPSSTPNHRDTIWLFADYRTVNSDGSVGAWTSASITAATVIAGNGEVIPSSLTGRGFFLNGNGHTSFNSTVQITLAAPVNTKFNACVYASDWPPNAILQSGGGYALKGTPPFTINGTIIEPSHAFGAGTCITSITDSTGCPGFVINPPIVTGSILTTGDTVCVDGAPSPITSIAAFSGGDGQLSYLWYKNGVLIDGATGADYTPPVEDAAVAGAHTYTRKVKDRTCNITPLASEGNYVLTVEAAPTVTLSAASATVCKGTEVMLEASATPAAAKYLFDGGAWQTGNTKNVTVNSDTTFTVKARSAAGCETATAASTTVAAETAPTNVTLTPSSATVCAGTEITLEASATPAAAGYSFNDGAWQTGNTKNVIVNSDTTFTVKARSALGCESAEATTTVATGAVPTNVTLTPSSATVCVGTEITLEASADGVASYSFNGGNWQIANTTNVIVNSDTTFTVKAVSALGCESAEASVAVTTKAAPTTPTGASANSRCGPGTITFSVTAPSECIIDWYTASSDGTLAFSGATSFSTSLTATTSYYAQAKHNNTGCVSASRQRVIGTVNALPTTPTNASANSRCGSGTITFSAAAPSGCTIDWYTLPSGGSTVAVGMTSFLTSLTTTTSYYAQAKHNNTGCVSALRLQVTGTVHNTFPTAPTGASSNTRCGSGTLTFSATALTGCTIDWYTLPSGGSPVAVGMASYSPNLTATTTTTYYAQARDNSTGCVSASRLAVSGTVYASIGTISISGTSSNTCPDETVILTATASGATSFTWYNGNGTQLQTGTSPNYTVTETGFYYVEVSNVHCSGSLSNNVHQVRIYGGCVPGCGNLHVSQSTDPSDGQSANVSAINCPLPTIEELICMCENKATLPGGYVSGYYWSGTKNPSTTSIPILTEYYAVYFNPSVPCNAYSFRPSISNQYNYRCAY